MKSGGQVSGQVLFLFKLYLLKGKNMCIVYQTQGKNVYSLNTEEDESVRELCNSIFLVK